MMAEFVAQDFPQFILGSELFRVQPDAVAHEKGEGLVRYEWPKPGSKAAEPKELFVIPGASHVDLYDVPKHLAVSIPKLDKFFKDNLK